MEAYLGISTDKLLTAGAETIYMVCISLFIGAIIFGKKTGAIAGGFRLQSYFI